MCTVVTKQPQKRDSELQPTAITDCRLTNEQAPGEAGQVLRAWWKIERCAGWRGQQQDASVKPSSAACPAGQTCDAWPVFFQEQIPESMPQRQPVRVGSRLQVTGMTINPRADWQPATANQCLKVLLQSGFKNTLTMSSSNPPFCIPQQLPAQSSSSQSHLCLEQNITTEQMEIEFP